MKQPCQSLEVSRWARDAIYGGLSIYLRVPMQPGNSDTRGGAWRDIAWHTARGYLVPGEHRSLVRAQKSGRAVGRYVDVAPAINAGQAIWLTTGAIRERYFPTSVSAARLQDLTDWQAVQSGALTVNGAQRDPVVVLEDIMHGTGPHRRRVIGAHVPTTERAMSPRELYAARWDADHSKGAEQWKSNPWTWELTIRPLDRRGTPKSKRETTEP